MSVGFAIKTHYQNHEDGFISGAVRACVCMTCEWELKRCRFILIILTIMFSLDYLPLPLHSEYAGYQTSYLSPLHAFISGMFRNTSQTMSHFLVFMNNLSTSGNITSIVIYLFVFMCDVRLLIGRFCNEFSVLRIVPLTITISVIRRSDYHISLTTRHTTMWIRVCMNKYC